MPARVAPLPRKVRAPIIGSLSAERRTWSQTVESFEVKCFLTFLQTYFIGWFLNDEVQASVNREMRIALVQLGIVFRAGLASLLHM